MLRNLLVIFVVVGWGSLSVVMAGDDLAYRDRGTRHEGTQSKPIGGYDIELLGAVVEPGPPATSDFPDRSAISFLLEREEIPNVIVRERRPEQFYWLDRVKPGAPWRVNATNTFRWPSGDVLRPLGLAPRDLLFLIRLGGDKPRAAERVAPVLVEPAPGGRRIGGYRFTFRTQADAKIRSAIYDPASAEPLAPFTPSIQRAAGVPFDVVWNAEGRAPGPYRLVLQGYFTADSHPITQTVELFHNPVWPE